MKIPSWLIKISKLMPVIIIDLALLFFLLNSYGHIDLLTDQERQEKITELEIIIEQQGCINRKEARKKLGLNKHEMVEVVKNASGYPPKGARVSEIDAPSFPILSCYMVQKK